MTRLTEEQIGERNDPRAWPLGPADLALTGWHGFTRHPVEVVGHTKKRVRIRLGSNVRLPGARDRRAGDIVLVPPYALRSRP
jgi:hypothetical protein